MSWLSSIIKKAAPIVATVSPEPISRGVATALSVQYANQEASYQKKLAEERRKEQKPMEFFGNQSPSAGAVNVPPYRLSTQQAGNTGFFSGVGDFFRGAGEVVSSAFSSGIPQLFGVGRPRGVTQQPAITSVTNVGAQESQGSGSIQAGMGGLLPSLVSGARTLIKSPLGQVAFGTGVGGAISF